MKRSFTFLLSTLLFASLSFAQTAQPVSQLEQNLRKHVEYLASDKLEGRRAGERGANLAGEYVADQFKRLKLKPGVIGMTTSGPAIPSYKQHFSYTPVHDPHSTPADPTSTPAAPDAKQAFNVIGILPGTDPILKNEAIVIGAHYDHLGHGGSGSLAANSTEIHHGADDNASGTAAVIELARMFKSEPGAVATGFRNKRTIIFIAFSGEEDGLFGSKYYVNNPVWPLDKTVAMINLDMVGRLNENKLNVGGIGTASEFKQMVELVNGSLAKASSSDKIMESMVAENLKREGITGVAVTVYDHEVTIYGNVPKAQVPTIMTAAFEAKPRKVINNLNRPPISSIPDRVSPFTLQLNEDGFGPSDHSSFYGKQIPVLFYFTGTHTDYHKPSDTADKINYAGEANVISYVASIAKSIVENPTRPTYAIAKSSNTGGRTGFSISLGTIPSYADSTDGMELDGVRDDSPAAKAGLKKGDKVIKLAGKEIKNVYDYTAAMGEMKAGQEYEIVIKRGNETLTLKIIPAPARR